MENENLRLICRVGIKCSTCEEKMGVDLLKVLSMEERNNPTHQCENCGLVNNLFQNKDFLGFAEKISENKEEFRRFFLETLDEVMTQIKENYI